MNRVEVELLWFAGCPNHKRAREALDRVLASRGIDASTVRSIEIDAASAESTKFPGSPTIRVDGRDIEPGFQDAGGYMLSCRVYQTSTGLQGSPEPEWIERAVDAALSRRE